MDECEGMQEYVDQIVNTSNKLSGIGFEIDDEWIGAILLAGLTDSYQPLIMGIESSGTKISGDTIISKLIDNRIESKSKDNAFLGKKDKKKQKCRYCDKDWDKKHRCLNKNKKNNGKSESHKRSEAFFAFMAHEIQVGSEKNKNAKEQKNKTDKVQTKKIRNCSFMSRYTNDVTVDPETSEKESEKVLIAYNCTEQKNKWY